MHDWLGIGLVALGLGLVFAGMVKYRARQSTPVAAGAIRPEFAAMGEIVRPLILFAVGFVALKMSLFYFVFGGTSLLTPLAYGGLMFVLAAYCGIWWLPRRNGPKRSHMPAKWSRSKPSRPHELAQRGAVGMGDR